MAYVALCKALYDYVAQAEDELNLSEDDYLYILESDDSEWWKAKLRRLNEDGTPIQDDPDEGTVGLVPANYVEEAEPIRLSRALYDYEAQTEDELSMAEDELLRVYESDGVWLLVKKQGNDPLSGGEGRLGYVPANYVDEAEAVDTGTAPVTEDQYGAAEDEEEEDDDDDDADVTGSGAAIPQIQLPQTAHLGKGDEIKMWPVSALDTKKKKKKGTLGIGNASLFFASESDKTPVQKISVLHIASHSLEKGKTLHLQLSPDAGMSESNLDFHCGSKDAANEIVRKIEASKANALTAAAAPPASPAAPPAAPAVATAGVPLPPPPPPAPPAPPAAASTLPPPSRTAGAVLPPPIRKTVSFQSQQEAAAAAEPEETVEHGIAMYDFEAQGDDELTVAENEHLIILEKENDDWWKVRNDAGQEGVVPASYVEASDAAASEAGASSASASAAALAAQQEEEKRIRQEEDEAAAVAEAERQREAAEATARRQRETDEREKERTRRDALKAQPAPAPPKLTQRPSTTEVTRAAKDVSIPTGRSAPERPKDGGSRSKPSPNNTRMWTDRTGQFKVEAEFLGFNQGKIRLHKMNGVVIEVAVEKMSDRDIAFLEDITGKKLNPTDQEIAAASSASRRRERERQSSSRSQVPSSGTSMSREERERERERRKEKEREQRRREQSKSGPKRNVDWFEFFLAAGVDVDECTRYASSFERDKIDETVLPDLDPPTLRSIGLREGDIIRVTKFIDKKYRRDKTHTASSSSSRQSGRVNANTAADLERQIKADEELARKLQEQEQSARRGDSVSPAPPQLFSGPDGTLKNNTRRGRPTPKTTGSNNVDAASLAAASESLARTTSPPARTTTASPAAAPKRTGSSLANGFDDDAWTPRPPSTKPATPARPNVASPAPPAPTPPPAAAPSPAPAVAASPAPADPNSALFEKLAAMKPPSASERPGASPSPGSSFLGQNQAYNPNAPRGPFAPVPANQSLLQPLVPTQGTGQFVPTKLGAQQTGMMGMQMTGMQGMQPQQAGWGMQGMQGMQPQMTGYSNGMGGMGLGMQPQMTGLNNGIGGMNGSSPFAGGQMNNQQTGFPGMQPQQTGLNNFGQNPQQMAAQQTGFGMGSQQQVYQQQAAQEEKDKFNASNIFQQMKTGAFAKDPNAAPQSSDKYDALRPQPTGFQPGGVMPQFTGMGMGMGFGQQPQQQQQGYPHNGYGGYGGGYGGGY
ncbi:hypothetical protein NDA11_004326 [Ustilago hordei]|uniref:Actin cytoskeleton-regulatory complex protein SLA1 n=1 Tax=Ustilago hordei TaxID=120017 RepID=I2FSC0_USTHO|nr:uncharacterized protein UHO2_05790 [Ustilago hordei]KAJ1042028.1 hypothetical protein NDA10_005520 [Ustilago hordei]KAJ1576680.1 hypothetical protein NDA11_004326 [Ustilago hordei]CCF49813.1 related to SLA1-cytoskeleton assembly control protein [Ustilago hordei]SYW84830.1 related to SLA1 - cytoskeleton assembly control protein [Ustilago hordei]